MAQFKCDETFGLLRISKRLRLATRTQKSLNVIIEGLKKHSQFHTETVLPATVTRRKRNIPWFGFIGKIAGPVAGILNYEDGKRYEQAIEELNLGQSNISKLMNEQTHLVRSELNKIHQVAEQRESEMNAFHQIMGEYWGNLTEINQHIIIAEFETLALKTALALEFSIEEYQVGLDEIITTIRGAQEGILHPSLITKDQIITIAREIEEAMPGLDFPIPMSQINVIDFMRLSKVSIRIQGKRILVVIDIPLLGQDIYDLYKLHQVPILQTGQPKADRAYILPRSKYLALERDNKRYFYLDDNVLHSCKMNNDKYICQINQAIYDATVSPSCEVNLLRRPTLEILRTCDIRLSTNQQPYWTPVLSLGGWLYSVSAPEIAQLSCNREQPKKLKIKGSGILQIGTNCIIRTDSVTLTALPESVSFIHKIFFILCVLNRS
ncbi:uncharacterized protein LOC127291639 [Leptopilina boulardi]|uniref:uncharacterized protein LOC127291639 n=1 Tax=Leptopilina boulardi TaxID=63433 RepID=UPI0021F588A6|nr:uncharacterized protein LOC127291639 [Leptopilina boulardi]